MIKDSPARIFKGVWIPVEVWDDDRLTWFEKCLWAEVKTLSLREEGCTASNQHLANIFKTTAQTIANALSGLRALGLIKDIPNQPKRAIVAICASYDEALLEPNLASPRSEGGLTPGLKGVNPGVKANGAPNIKESTVESTKRYLPPNPQGGSASASPQNQKQQLPSTPLNRNPIPIVPSPSLPRIMTAPEDIRSDSDIAKLARMIWEIFDRPITQQIPARELPALAAIVRRPGWIEEVKAVQFFCKKSKEIKLRKASNCLEDWDGTVDMARVFAKDWRRKHGDNL